MEDALSLCSFRLYTHMRDTVELSGRTCGSKVLLDQHVYYRALQSSASFLHSALSLSRRTPHFRFSAPNFRSEIFYRESFDFGISVGSSVRKVLLHRLSVKLAFTGMEFTGEKLRSVVSGLLPECGAIFMSNTRTKKECLRKKLFGLPSSSTEFVKNVKAGMVLFPFEYERRKLYGVFKAASDGEINIVPSAYGLSGKHFPAQV
ncbi:uncharacterized protein LOC116188799 [Punica granatum]|uniref:Uncharacterized protein LOC116188799 n=1 Tax=Punica granatum TaxID=22663 RepID=A0A6P8BUZ2_PUNGR|nr:uncharacterized protein LOC116188799 [Punica granatum]